MISSYYQANVSSNKMTDSEEPDPSSTKPRLLGSLFAVIAVVAFAGNGLFCTVIIEYRRRLLRSPYHLLIFSLAVVDMLTGVFIVATPGYVIDFNSFPVPGGLGGEIFCHLISTQYFIFILGKVSVLTIVALALERWYSIIKPISYKMNFSRKRIYIYTTVIWLLSALSNVAKPIKGRLDRWKLKCFWDHTAYPEEIFIPIYTTLTFYVPTLVTWLSFIHVAGVLRKSLADQNQSFCLTRKKLTRMCALVSLLLTMCWLPNQIFYTLSGFNIVRAETPLHYFTIVLGMFNSCVNPCVCYYTNRDYKTAMTHSLLCFRLINKKGDNSSTAISEVKNTNSVISLIGFRYLNPIVTGESEGGIH